MSSEKREQPADLKPGCPLVRERGYKECPMLCVGGYEDCHKRAFYPDNSGQPAWLDKDGNIHPRG